MLRTAFLFPALFLGSAAAWAGPDLECPGASQVEIGNCVADALERVDGALEASLSFAITSAKDLDQITERESAVPALEAAQAAWSAYRDAHCDFVGATFGGGSGTGIGIDACRIKLGRARVTELLNYAR